MVLGLGCSPSAESPTPESSEATITTPDSDATQQTSVSAEATTAPEIAPTKEPTEPVAEATIANPPRLSDLPEPVAITDEDWPQFRGVQRDGISPAKGLARSFPAEGPPLLWSIPVGEGYAAPSVVDGKIYLNDYDKSNDTWMVRCLDLNTGNEAWRYQVPKRIRPNHGITRSAPATDGAFVISIDPKCEVHCLDARNGGLIWKKMLPAEYGGQIPAWYNGQCPMIDGDAVILATGGRTIMAAFNKATGEPIWETDNPDQLPLSHSSIMPVELDGVKQYTYTSLAGLIGVDANTGALLWHFPWKFNTAVTTTPVPVGDNKFFLTAGYHAETVVCQVKHDGDKWTAVEVSHQPEPTKGWNSEVQTPILHRGHLYGIGKKQRGLWTCLDLEGNVLWESGRGASFEMGSYVLAEEMFFVLEGKTGTLRVLDANADEYRELASFSVLQGPDVWAPPVISHGKLLIRDLDKLVCLNISNPQ
jgi:outer membrane protein assembly factor BamB